MPNLRVFSLDPNFDLTSVSANVFVQNYKGGMIEIVTKDGKRLKASPKHPLLVNNGYEIIWKSTDELKEGDFIGALKELPENPVLKDPVPDWLEKIEKECWIVTKERAKQLEEKTGNFRDFSQLSVSELNEIRILNKISCNKIQKACKGGNDYFSGSFKKGKLTKVQRESLIEFFSTMKTYIPEGTIINCKHKSQSFIEIADAGFNDEIIRFIALILSEGCLTSNNVKFSQSENELLLDFLNICSTHLKIKAVYEGQFDYAIRNKALVKFLEIRYGLQEGNSYKSSIPKWIFSLPNKKLCVFLRSFFSAEGNVNEKSNQIALIQANKKSIYLIGYALKKFGVSNSIHPTWKRATNSNSPKREYWQLFISDSKSLRIFQEKIGFDLPYKQIKLEKICSRIQRCKKTDHVVPIKYKLLSDLFNALGLEIKREYLKKECKQKPSWIFAYRDCRVKNAISEDKIRELLSSFYNRLKEMENINVSISEEFLTRWGISQRRIAKISGTSPKKVSYVLRGLKIDSKDNTSITNAILSEFENCRKKAREIFNQLNEIAPKNIEWCKIKSAKKIEYSGLIIDLQVPGYHNFVCGMGALIAHNTSLTQALTGKWTDTHSEEIKRGITIRLGYADVTFYYCEKCSSYANTLKCPKCFSDAEPKRSVSFIDAPGHETLMATVLSGASLMDGALLLISADEKCPQPQTAEHLKALDVVGIKNIIIVQNKIDLVSEQKAIEHYKQIKEFVKGTVAENAPIIPVSAINNANIDVLIETIEKNMPTPERDTTKPPKFYVARSFDVNKPGADINALKGSVIGGSLTQGVIKINDTLEIRPGAKIGDKWTPLKSKAVEIIESGQKLKEAKPGGLAAIQLDLDPALSRGDGLVGSVVGHPDNMPPVMEEMKLDIKLFEKVIGATGNQKINAVKTGDVIMLTAAIAKTVGVVVSANKSVVHIKLKLPVCADKGDKVALSMQVGGRWHLVGYGIVI